MSDLKNGYLNEQGLRQERDAFRAQVAGLRKALKPLANIICLIDDNDESKGYAFDSYRDDRIVFGVGSDRVITAGDLRRARAALEMTGGVK